MRNRAIQRYMIRKILWKRRKREKYTWLIANMRNRPRVTPLLGVMDLGTVLGIGNVQPIGKRLGRGKSILNCPMQC